MEGVLRRAHSRRERREESKGAEMSFEVRSGFWGLMGSILYAWTFGFDVPRSDDRLGAQEGGEDEKAEKMHEDEEGGDEDGEEEDEDKDKEEDSWSMLNQFMRERAYPALGSQTGRDALRRLRAEE